MTSSDMGFDLPLPRRGVLSGKFPRTSRRWRLSFVRLVCQTHISIREIYASCALKAKSPGSSPGNATKNYNKINSLKVITECRLFAVFVLVALW